MAADVFNIVNENSEHSLILTCEHASARIPGEYCNLGLSEQALDTHIARDKGCKEVTQKLAERLGCFAVMGGYSRLLIDLNRAVDEDELIVAESDKIPVPGNRSLSAEEKEKRVSRYYRPYYAEIEKQISRLQKMGKQPVIFSVHSFTPQLQGGNYRPWQAGILYHRPQKLASFMYEELCKSDKRIGENVPYDLRAYDTGAAVFCGERKGFDYALIEIRDDEFDNLEQGAEEWADLLEKILSRYLAES